MIDVSLEETPSHSGTTFYPDSGPSAWEMTRLCSFAEVNEALRSRRFVHVIGQRDNSPFLAGTLISLSGDTHFERRRIESQLFAPEATARHQNEIFMPAFEEALNRWPRNAAGRAAGDLSNALYRALSRLGASVVGFDGVDSEEALQRHMLYTGRIANGVNIEFSERDHREVIEESRSYLELMRKEFFEPSLRRRQQLVSDCSAGRLSREALPLDLITLMLLHEDQFSAFGPDTMLREAVFFNGASGGINHAVCNVVEAVLRWIEEDPDARRNMLREPAFLRRAALEAIRLRPATPFQIRKSLEGHTLSSGRHVDAGEYVLLDMTQANRDPSVFCEDADGFNPFRVPVERVKPTGLAFSNGPHTCIGMTLSIGDGSGFDNGKEGILIAALTKLFSLDVRADNTVGAKRKPGTTRVEFEQFPVSLDMALVADSS
jgi:cytochrome P450